MKVESKKMSGGSSREGAGSKCEERPAPLPEVYENAWLQLLRTTAELSVSVERDLEESAGGMTLAEFDILNALSDTNGEAGRGGRLTVSELTKFTRISRSAVSRLVDKMEVTNGYVRKRSKDGKAVWVEIMPAGRSAMKATLRPAWEQSVQTHFAKYLTEKNARELVDILASVFGGAAEEIDESAP